MQEESVKERMQISSGRENIKSEGWKQELKYDKQMSSKREVKMLNT